MRPSGRFWLALFLNTLALVAVSLLAAAGILPDNWIVSPLYILACAFVHAPFVAMAAKERMVLVVSTFCLFVPVNWMVISTILYFATI